MLTKNKKLLMAAWGCENLNYTTSQCWYDPFKKLFKDVALFDPQKNLLKYGRDEMNSIFIKIIEREKPDYIFFWLIADEYTLETLAHIKERFPKIITINLFGDDDINYGIYSRYYKDLFNCCLICQPRFLKNYIKGGNKNSYFIFTIPNPSVFIPLDIPKELDVTFIGYPKSDRYELIKYLLKNGIKISIFGNGWWNYKDIRKIYGGPLNFHDMVKVINKSKINLSFSKNHNNIPHIKGRLLETGLCKSFSLIEYCEDYKDYFKENDEIVMFKTKEELLKKIKYYLINNKERNRIANNLYKRLIKDYLLEKQLKEILNKRIYSINSFKFNKKNLKSVDNRIKKISVNLIKEKSKSNLSKLLKNYRYVSFVENDVDYSLYKDIIQVCSIEETKRPISCCDYYLNSKYLGKYLRFDTSTALSNLKKEEFINHLFPSQFIIEKNYFLANLEDVINLFAKKDNKLINKNNTSFVFIPLMNSTRVHKIKSYYFKKVIYWPLFVEKTISSIYQKRFFKEKYNYILLFEGLFRKRYIIKWFIQEKFNKLYAKKIRDILRNDSVYDNFENLNSIK